jgi:hypothetical protein
VRILFDQGTPVPLRNYLRSHAVSTAYEKGWSRLSNGELLAAAALEFDVLVATDKHLREFADAREQLASWPKLEPKHQQIVSAIELLRPGDYFPLTL